MAQPYDPYIPNSGNKGPNSGGGGNPKAQQVQAQVDEVVGIMQQNIDKVMQRGERLDDLRGKTERVITKRKHWPLNSHQAQTWRHANLHVTKANCLIGLATKSTQPLTLPFFPLTPSSSPHRRPPADRDSLPPGRKSGAQAHVVERHEVEAHHRHHRYRPARRHHQ
ncbi:hypothetical protein BC938DRAFT_473033 [Jimgerdemannia flammicorona]|uniref:V-SNARE coiled-coil homology domain-containing protein n=1 Tax=Jimgerdemannia flammicorona TaxID=994334 RepID=A0A433Q4V0_9FUNG|nr:hypothetical protein BC938DRAFT_473033 [Jimgerdemannia flammicorona]